MRIPTPGFLIDAFFLVCRRFPGTILVAFVGTIACFGLLESGTHDSEESFARVWITCQLGLPLLTALVAFTESKGWNESRGWIIQLLGLLLLVALWFWLDVRADHFGWKILPQYFALILIFHLAVSFAPFLNARPVRDFWEYNSQLFANFIVGSAFTFILFAGLALAILAVDNLFDLHISERNYARLFVALAGIFNTAYFLFHFPKMQPNAEVGSSYSWVFRNLCKYILIPIVILYFLILYAYGAKVGIQWSLPHGWISSLVIGFSVAGIFTYLLNFYLSEEDASPLVTGFKRWFWWIMLPPTGLLFIAIGRRISDYGVTEERFLVAQLGVWLALISVYFLFSKNDNIKFIPISLSLFALTWAFGPLSAFEVSERSQKGILSAILTQTGRFENGKMKPGTLAITAPEQAQVGSAIQYLSYHDALADLLPSPLDSNLLDYSALLSWLKIETMAADSTKHLSISPEVRANPMEVRGFDLAFPVEFNTGSESEVVGTGNSFSLSKDGKMLVWQKMSDGKPVLTEMFSFGPALQKWSEKSSKTESYTYLDLPITERMLNFTGKKGNVRCIIESAEIEMTETEKRLTFFRGWVLLKEK